MKKTITKNITSRLILVGPLPPPIGGGTVNVKVLLDELSEYNHLQTITINTSPNSNRNRISFALFEKFSRSIHIIYNYQKSVKNANAVLLIGTHSFIFSLGTILLCLAIYFDIPFFIKPLGAEIKQKLLSKNIYIQRYMLKILNAANGIMFQTKQLQTKFQQLGLLNAHYVPGYRPAIIKPSRLKSDSTKFSIVFLSQMLREKGPILLLDALRLLEQDNIMNVQCDFYGPILNEDLKYFLCRIQNTHGARYCGTAEIGEVSTLMTRYETLIFPTFCLDEGHPGAIIEAMHAGIAVISTQYSTATELIKHGENGLLVPVGDSKALASAIKTLALNHSLRKRMGVANFKRSIEFRSDIVVSQMLDIIYNK